MTFTTAEIAKLLAGEVLGDATATLTGFAATDAAKPGDLTFAENAEFFAAAENSAAAVARTSENTEDFVNRRSHKYAGADSSRDHQICAFVVSLVQLNLENNSRSLRPWV